MNANKQDFPQIEHIESEISRERYKKRYRLSLKSTVFTLITVAAVAILVATLWMPVLQIYGSSMTPTLEDGDIVISTTVSEMKTGDVIAFYYNNKVLVKRVIGVSGQWVDIKEDGTVYVNGEALDEPYVTEKAFGDCDINLPYQVPEGRIFVMGDHRSVSVDSRSSVVGCVSEEQIVGKIIFRIWPLDKIEAIR
ncbi:MAG: signal peptidase I [Clostridia bacterium]|nr:signal peptidase I [Clostridia bacterium]